jgi:hypothetical protein
LATDVLVAAITDDRLDGAALGQTLARLYDGRVAKAPRIAWSLGEAALVSGQHAEAVATIIENVLAGARDYLSGLQGSGKAVRLAQSLAGTPRTNTN